MFCFWFLESYLLDKTLFVHNIDAEILKALSMQVEVSSNRYHLLWGSVISFHMERIHIKLTRYQRKIDNIFHKINIQFNLTGTTKLYLCYLRIEIQTVSCLDYYVPNIINFPSILVSKVSCSLPIKAWKFSGNLSDDEHVFRTASQVLRDWEDIYSKMLISNQENPAKFSNMETNNGVNLKNWWIYTYQVLQFPMDSKIWTCFPQTGSADLSTKLRGLTIWL